MKYVDLSFAAPEANLACDEALLDACEAGEMDEVLRFWESALPFVVVGYSNRLDREVNTLACRKRNISVLRRCSGGGTVVQGPGSLNYSLCLRFEGNPLLGTIPQANRFVMERHRDAFRQLLGAQVEVQGHTDLSVDNLKFSGNAQRRKRRFLLFHGSILLGLDLALMEELLPSPSLEPSYRQGRPHLEFVTNLTLAATVIKNTLRESWNATVPLETVPTSRIDHLVREKYATEAWNLRF